MEIIKNLDNEFFFVSFGIKSNFFKGIKNFGYINDKNKLRKIYSAANLFISFSKQEAFGKTLGESIMCNTPVLAKNNNSSEEIVKNKKNGYIVENDDYIEGINWIKKNLDKRKKPFSLQLFNNFKINHISKQYLELYNLMTQ